MSDSDQTLTLEKREVIGKQVKTIRRAGLVPAVIHDHGKPSMHVMAPYMEVAKAYREAGKNQPLTLQLGKKRYMAMIKDVAIEPKKGQLQHVVFNAVNANETVEAEVPVQVRFSEGNDAAPAERAGLIVLHTLDAVEVEALPSKLPETLYYDGEKLVEVGDTATVADLEVPEGVKIMTDAAQVIANVYEPSALQAANDAAGGDAEEPVEPIADEQAGESEEPAEPEAEQNS